MVPEELNQCWSEDFILDALRDGQRFQTFNVIDDRGREALAIEIDSSLGCKAGGRGLDRLAEFWGLPRSLRFDNGSELTSIAVAVWAEQNGVELDLSNPASRCRPALSNDLTGRIWRRFSIFIYLKI